MQVLWSLLGRLWLRNWQTNMMVVDKCSWVSPLEPGPATWVEHPHGCLGASYPRSISCLCSFSLWWGATGLGTKGWWHCLQRELPRCVKCNPCHSLIPCASACSTDHPGFHYSPEGEMKSSYQPKEGTAPHRVRRKSGELTNLYPRWQKEKQAGLF